MKCGFCSPLQGNHVLAAQCDLKCVDPFGEKGLCDCYMSGHGTDDPTAAERDYADDDDHQDRIERGDRGSKWLQDLEDRREAATHIAIGG